jgi:hypothetical protein
VEWWCILAFLITRRLFLCYDFYLVLYLDINQPGPDSGKTALDFARDFKQEHVVQFLSSLEQKAIFSTVLK